MEERAQITSVHKSVLLHEVLHGLSIEESDVVLDATLGGGGYSREILKTLNKEGVLVGIDQDETSIKRAEKEFEKEIARIYLVDSNFRYISIILENLGIKRINKAVFDLGLSSDQLESSERGFSFKRDEPLDMRMSTERELTAKEIVNSWSEAELEAILKEYGEEKKARRIAGAIGNARKTEVIKTTSQLVSIIESVASRRGKVHPATKTFQALRIAVNDELGALSEGLTEAYEELTSQGRIAVVSFHSLEDRIVKHFFQNKEKEGKGIRVNKKPIIPAQKEVKANPRARSAKLRIFEKA
ncbi:MAG: 16S rRNA (cytosine(1402)-N(4))-methyltransferase RsmH [Candidatus Paceibacterota bacterium]